MAMQASKNRSKSEAVSLQGNLLDKIFYNEENGFFIGRLDMESWVAKIKGVLPGYRLGLKYTFKGKWVSHPQYGKSFQFSEYSADLPVDGDAVQQYLENFKWLGPVLARKIVKAYGGEALIILKEQPDRVASEIKGLTIDRAAELSTALIDVEAEESMQIEMTKLFNGLRVPKSVRGMLISEYGSAACDMIKEDPYRLIESFKGVGFLTADQLAKRVGIAGDNRQRMLAAINHALADAARGEGHTVLPIADAIKRIVMLTGQDKKIVKDHIDQAADESKIAVPLNGWIATQGLAKAEQYCAKKIIELLHSMPTVLYTDNPSDDLKEDQEAALKKSLEDTVFILTGAPGTGKTYTITSFIKCFETVDLSSPEEPDMLEIEIAMAAPTGKAARRMTEMTGFFAQTIHKLLEPEIDHTGRFRFTRDEANPIDADVIIIDETSMLDITLAANLLRAIKPGTRLIFVGDTYQLPPVGPGNFMRDLIACGQVPTEELTEIKRQDPGNIITNCHKIKAGKMPVRDNNDGSDFLFLPRKTGDEVRGAILKLVIQALPKNYGVDPLRDIQVITPLRTRTILGCNEFNKTLQDAFNPASSENNPQNNKSKFRIGDKVIQNKNDYKNYVINGDVGFVQDINMKKNLITISFDSPDREVDLPLYDNDLDLAYAITCHKYQGSEAPIVVIPILSMFGSMILQRSWIYTAISRAQRLCVMVGDWREVGRTVKRMSQIKRQTSLQGLIKKEMGETK